MKKVFIVRLTETERSELEALVRKGKTSALVIARARVLLKADQGPVGEATTDAEIAEALSIAPKTVFNVRRRWVEHGLEAALYRKKQACASRARKLDGEADRNLRATQVHWQFPTDAARAKLRRLDPEFVRQDEHGGVCVRSKTYN